MNPSARYDDLYGMADEVAVRSPPPLAYTDIGLGCADGDAFVTYRVQNVSAQTICETVQIYIEIVYPNGQARKRMVGWEVHRLTPGADRYVRITQCGFAFSPSANADAYPASLTVMICSLSRLRAQANRRGVFSFEDMKIPPAEGGSPSAGSRYGSEVDILII